MDILFRFVALSPPGSTENGLHIKAGEVLAGSALVSRIEAGTPKEATEHARAYLKSAAYSPQADAELAMVERIIALWRTAPPKTAEAFVALAARASGQGIRQLSGSILAPGTTARWLEHYVALRLARADKSLALRLANALRITAALRASLAAAPDALAPQPASVAILVPRPGKTAPPAAKPKRAAPPAEADQQNRKRALDLIAQRVSQHRDHLTETELESVDGLLDDLADRDDAPSPPAAAPDWSPWKLATRAQFAAAGLKVDAKDSFAMVEAKLAKVQRAFGFTWSTRTPIGPDGEAGDGIPATVGRAKLLGNGLLLRVEDKVIGYEVGTIADIANFPKAVKKEAEFRRIEQLEETSESETEDRSVSASSRESEENLSISEESEKALRSSLEASVSGGFSGLYGPVTVQAQTETSASLSMDTAQSTASEFAKKVVERASSEVSRRVRALLRTTRLVKTERRTLEASDNVGGASHISAIYQWVNEVHEARLVNYGVRQFVEFIVPEPGKTLAWGASHSPRNDLPQPPPALDVTIGEISTDPDSPNFYLTLAERFGASGVAPPPTQVSISKILKVGEDIKDDNSARKHVMAGDDTLVIPAGYVLDRIDGHLLATQSVNATSRRYWVTIGTKRYMPVADFHRTKVTIKPERDGNFSFLPKTGAIPIAVGGVENRGLTIALAARARPQRETMDAWRTEVYQALRRAYLKAQSAYEDALYTARASGGTLALGEGNPDQNRERMREELKRGAITLLTRQHFTQFGALRAGTPAGRPLIDFEEAAAEGPYMLFFEQGFEWEQMEYSLYPYYWSNPERSWLDKISLHFSDPAFERFMRAGAARIVVPIRRDFQTAVLTYLSHPEAPVLWNGEDYGGIGYSDEGDLDPMFVPVWQELMELQGKTDIEPQPYGTPWRFTLPTPNQILRTDSTLPAPPA